MKKLFGITICLVLVFSMLSVAHAETKIYCRTTSKVDFESWASPAQSSGRQWHFTWESPTNISENHRAVVRIMTTENTFASTLWVYSTWSTAYHPYYEAAAYGNAFTYPTGRLDDRDSGILEVSGYFYN